MADFKRDGIIGNDHGIKIAGKSYVGMIEDAAIKTGLPEVLISHQIYRESSFRPAVVSPKGAVGLMQIMPTTAPEIAAKHNLPAEPLTDPVVNISLGTAYMRDLFDAAYAVTGDKKTAYELALVGYNAGPSRMAELIEGDVMNQRERTYVNNVIWDFDRTESWNQVKTKADKIGRGLASLWWLLIPVGYFWYKSKK
jgi:soluble lytic murein transglycosylase-like protein